METRTQKHEISLLLSVIMAILLVVSVPTSAQNLIAHWSFDEGEGTTAHDSVNSNHGTLNGPSWVSGRINNALSFDGTDDYVEVPDSESLKPTEAITIEAWIKPTATDYYRTIVSKYWVEGYYLRLRDGEIDFGSVGCLETEPDLVPTNVWSHVVGTYSIYVPPDGGYCTRIYLDGVLVKSGWSGSGNITNVDDNLRIGAWPNTAELSFNGIIDEVSIYASALSEEEIWQHYMDAGGTIDLISKWTFDEGEGTTAFDSVRNNDGTLYNEPTWTTGYANGGLAFDGTDDYVEVPDSPSLKPTDAITLEAWVKPNTVDGSHTIISKYYGYGYYLRISNAKIDFFVRGWIADGTVPTGSWSYIVGTYNASDAMSKIYLDGQLVASGQKSSPPPCPITNHDCDLRIGAWPISGGLFFDGDIDEVAVYGRVLSAGEIQQNYQYTGNGQPPDEWPPVANAGANQLVEATTSSWADVTLDGSGFPEPLTYTWTWNGGSATGPNPTISLPAGTTTITLVVNDGTQNSTPDTVDITVLDHSIPPTANVTYTSNFDGTRYTYYLTVENTSQGAYSVRDMIFGHDGPFVETNPDNQTFTYTAHVSSPDQWNPHIPYAYEGNAEWWASWDGVSSSSSGYIPPGASLSGFAFSSSSAPPQTAPFVVSFYDNMSKWGFSYHGTAIHVVPTSSGTDVQVQLNSTDSITFQNVDDPGTTSLTTSDEGPELPSGFMLGESVTYYEIATTANYTGEIDISISYSGITFTGPAEDLKLYHFEGGQWNDCTTGVDTVNKMIFGTVSSLSPFIIGNVADNQPPIADAGPDQTVEQTSYAGAEVILDGSGSTDPDSSTNTNDDIIHFDWWNEDTPLWSGEIIYPVVPPGTYVFTLIVTDHAGASDSDEVTIVVQDTKAPTLLISASPDVLWPPNNKMVKVEVYADITDTCDPNPYCKILNVTCNEPIENPEDGGTEPDWEITGDLTLNLRAERLGSEIGRVYTIEVGCSDASGNTSYKTVNVIVPHDQDKKKK